MTNIQEIEKCVIGSILLDPSCISQLYGTLEPKHFSLPVLRRTYAAMLHLSNSGAPITLLSVSNLLQDDDTPPEWVLQMYKDCSELTVTSAQIKYHANIIIDEYRKREYARIITEKKDGSVTEVIGGIINDLEKLLGNKVSNTMSLADVWNENKEKYFNPYYNPNYLYFGFNHLDALVGGIEDSDLVCIGARPSVGKSIFVLNLAFNICKNKKVMLYTLEMSRKQILDRLLTFTTDIEMNKIRKAKEFDTVDQQNYFKQQVEKNIENNKSLMIHDSGELCVNDIRNECKYIENLGVIVIDYLQLMRSNPGERPSNRTQAVGDISKGLKALANELRVPIIILSQLSRKVEYTADKEPVLADLRESGDIEQDCNIIMFIWNCNQDDLTIKGVSVAKNRQGTIGKMKMKFQGEKMKWYELDDKNFTQPPKPQSKKSSFSSLNSNEDLPFGREDD